MQKFRCSSLNFVINYINDSKAREIRLINFYLKNNNFFYIFDFSFF